MINTFSDLEEKIYYDIDNKLSSKAGVGINTFQSNPEVGTITLIIIGAVLSWLIQRCLDDLFPKHVQSPGLMSRLRFRVAVSRIINENLNSSRYINTEAMMCSAYGAADKNQLMDEILEHFYAAGRELSDQEFYSLKENRLGYVPKVSA